MKDPIDTKIENKPPIDENTSQIVTLNLVIVVI
jgi:hypothetical protein